MVGTADLWRASMEGRGLSEATIRRRIGTLERLSQSVEPDTASPFDIETWLLSQPVSAASRACYLGDLRAYYKWARRRGIVQADPTDLVDGFRKKKYTPRPARRDDLAHALEHAPPRIARIILLGTLAGLRRAEIAELHTDDISDGHLRVRGKGDKVRIVPLHPDLIPHLRIPRGPVIASERGGHLSAHRVGMILSTFLRGLGIDVTSHQNRHRFGADTYEACKDLRTVQKLMGHGSTQTTENYVPFSDTAAVAAIHALTVPYLPDLLSDAQRTLF